MDSQAYPRKSPANCAPPIAAQCDRTPSDLGQRGYGQAQHLELNQGRWCSTHSTSKRILECPHPCLIERARISLPYGPDRVILFSMGSHYNFCCLGCGYSAEVSGGPDYGFVAQTDTKICNTCRAVVDVLVGTRDPNQISTDELNQCPECDGNDLTPWDDSRPCPRCNGTMNADPTSPTTMWD